MRLDRVQNQCAGYDGEQLNDGPTSRCRCGNHWFVTVSHNYNSFFAPIKSCPFIACVDCRTIYTVKGASLIWNATSLHETTDKFESEKTETFTLTAEVFLLQRDNVLDMMVNK